MAINQGGLQLLPETRKKIEVKIPGENKLIGLGIFGLVVTVVVFVILNGYARTLEDQVTQINGQILALDKLRDKDAEASILAVQKQTRLIGKLLGDHIYITKALATFGNLLQPQLQVGNLKISTSIEKLSFAGNAASYITVARQVASLLANDSVKDVVLGNLKTNTAGRIELTADVLLNGAKFFKK